MRHEIILFIIIFINISGEYSSSSSSSGHRSSCIHFKSCFKNSLTKFQRFYINHKPPSCPECGAGPEGSICRKPHRCDANCGRILSINYPLNYTSNHRSDLLFHENSYFHSQIPIPFYWFQCNSLRSSSIPFVIPFKLWNSFSQ